MPPPADDELASDSATILVVEDEVLIRLMIAGELRHAGLIVLEASNAEEAVSILRSQTGVDLVLSDIRMPGSIDGLALARYLRDNHPDIPIALASALPARSFDAGISDAYFQKPYVVEAVVDWIRRRIAARNHGAGR